MRGLERSNQGFGLLELLISISLLAFLGTAFVSAYLTGERLVRQGLSQAKIQSFGRIGMEKVERYLRVATSAVALGGDQIQFVVDTNANPYSPNLVTRSLSFSTGDGSESTPNDNTLVYDPNVLNAGDEQVVMQNIRRLPGNNIFSVSGKVVTIRLRLQDTMPTYLSATYGGSNVDIATQVYMRN